LTSPATCRDGGRFDIAAAIEQRLLFDDLDEKFSAFQVFGKSDQAAADTLLPATW
jgi:hypothetical protein